MADPLNPENRELIIKDLNRLCEYSSFKRSKNSSKILRYLIEAAINGETENLKEYTIAREALGEGINFDPQLNPRIRVELKRLRERLKEAYQHLAAFGPFQFLFDIPKGSYAPVIIPWDQGEIRDPISPSTTLPEQGALPVFQEFHGHLRIKGFLEGEHSSFNLRLMLQELWFNLLSQEIQWTGEDQGFLDIVLNAYPLSKEILIYGKVCQGPQTINAFRDKFLDQEEDILEHAVKLAAEISQRIKELSLE
jgi:predicted DNA-binding protein